MGNPWLIVWIAVALLTLIAEAFTMALTSIWFTIGAIAAMIANLLGAAEWLQIVIFAAVSILVLLFARPFCKKVLKIGATKTNVDAIPGKIGIVSEEIHPVDGTGLVKLDGQIWSAKPKDGYSVIPAGTSVRVTAVEGVKVIVEPIEAQL